MHIPSKLISDVVDAFARLPGIGKKTALRLTLHLLGQEREQAHTLGSSIIKMREDIQFCKICHNISDGDVCSICAAPSRDKSILCVVEQIRDVLAIESTGHYNGMYHILGGIISPLQGIGPDDLYIDSLLQRVGRGEVKEVIMALNPTIEGDTTIFYLSKQLEDISVRISTIARGIAFGAELEYTDEITLARSIATRLPYTDNMTNQT